MKNIITTEELIEKMEKEYLSTQPMRELSGFEQGKLIGYREIIEHMKELIK